MTSTSIPLTPAELGKIAGPFLLTHLLNWGLFGVLSMQVYMYYLAFPNDRFSNKALVYGVYLLDAAQTFILTRTAFRTFASGFGNLADLNEIDIIWVSEILMGLVAFLTQAFYAYRITVLSRKNSRSVLIMLLAFLSLGGCIAASVESKIAVLFSRAVTKRTLIAAGIWGGGSAACDVLIAASMIYYLKRHDSGLGETRALLAQIIRLTIEAGSATASVAILNVILVSLPGHPSYYITSLNVAGKMYSNSMMASFNSRMKIGASNNTIVSRSCEFRSAFMSNGSTAPPDKDEEFRRLERGKTDEEVCSPPMSQVSED